MKRGMAVPSPIPKTIMAMVASVLVESTFIRASSTAPPTMIDSPTTPRTLYRPRRDMSWPDMPLAIAIEIIIGMVTRPEFVAERPITP